MLADYMTAAMQRAVYKNLETAEVWGEIPGFEGLWAVAPTQTDCEHELAETLEEWALLGLRLGHELPILDDISLNFEVEDVA